jgi:beta-glucosidase
MRSFPFRSLTAAAAHQKGRRARFGVAAGLIGFGVAGAVGCEHSDIVLNAPAGAGVTAPRYLLGLNPTQALPFKAVETSLGTTPPATPPFTDSNNRRSCGDQPIGDLYITDPDVVKEAESLLFQMTIDDKVIQLTGLGPPSYSDQTRWEDIQRSRDIPALNLAGYQWRDGPHGLNLEAGAGRDPLQNYSTSFPTSVVQGATWDLDLVYRVGEAMGDETAASGNNVLLAPCMNLLRNPLWGRAQETFGEDSFHLGRVATALTVGLQTYVTGCAKHYLANNIEVDRMSINSTMDEQTLREIYGRHFEMVSRDGGIGCMMASYNLVNGKKATQNKHLLSDVLRLDFGFRGFVLTDWWAMPARNNGQGPADPPEDLVTAAEAIEAGLDVEVPWGINFDAIPSLVASGTISQQVVDNAVKRVLEQKLRFKSAYLGQPYYGLRQPKSTYVGGDVGALTGPQLAVHADLAREAAEKGMVLLKNDEVAPGKKALPISGATTVAVIGATVQYYVRSDRPQTKYFDFARDAALGDRGSSRVRPDPAQVVGPLAGIQAAAARHGVNVIAGDTAAAAANADFVVVVVGLTPEDEGEEYTGAGDRRTLELETVHKEGPQAAPKGQPPNVTKVHNPLVESVAALGKPMVVVVQAGGAVNMPWRDRVNSIVMAWYPGQRGGEALGRLLFGEANFAGRLPVTWPQSLDQFPAFSGGDKTAFHDYFTGYRWFDQNGLTPLYAFGYGLSYSTFAYERLHVPCGTVTAEGLIQIEVDVRNASGPAGDEVIQVYASYPGTRERRSKKELKGFARVSLQPGEAKRVSIPLRIRDLRYWDADGSATPKGNPDWVVEKAPVTIQVGPSSDKLLLTETLSVN